MPSNHLILCCPLLLLPSIFPSIRVFSMSQLFTSGGQYIGASASASVLPMNIQGWFPLGLTGLISLLSKGLSRVFSKTTNWKHHSPVKIDFFQVPKTLSSHQTPNLTHPATFARNTFSVTFLWWTFIKSFSSVQFSSVAQSCLTLCDPVNCSMPGLPVHHQFPEFTQTHVHRVGDAIQPSHPLSSPSPPAPNPS